MGDLTCCVWPGDRIGEVILVRGQVGIVNIWQSGKQSKVFYSQTLTYQAEQARYKVLFMKTVVG